MQITRGFGLDALVELELSGRSATARAAWQQYGEALREHRDRSPVGVKPGAAA